jgi:hypothetical protein
MGDDRRYYWIVDQSISLNAEGLLRSLFTFDRSDPALPRLSGTSPLGLALARTDLGVGSL